MVESIIEEIKQAKKNLLTYEEYMSIALYDPQIGYYMKNNKKLGPEGDFYTSSGVHAVFGKVFAHFFLDIIEKENLPAKICEFGGGDGRFAKAVLDEWEEMAPKGKENLSYSIIETSPYHREEQMKLLSNKNGFTQFDSLIAYQEIEKGDFEGIVFSNELIDALPVHVIEMHNSEIYEVFVTYDKESKKLIEEKQLCTNENVLLWLEKYGPILKEQQRIEIPLNMNKWIKEINNFMKRGLLITIDYGFTKEEWTMPQRKKGSLRGYYKHQLVNDPLLHPTEMDLTTHIHLDAYEAVLKEEGFVKVYDERQNRFLLKIGLLKFLKENFDPNPFSEKSKQNRAIQTLINDSGISAAFHVFLHGKQLSAINSYRLFHDDPYKI